MKTLTTASEKQAPAQPDCLDDPLNALIERIEHLPPSPRVLIKLIDLFKQPDQDVDEVVQLITHDPGFTSEVLKRCNSAYFGTSEPAGDIFEAVSRLGFQEVYTIVLAMFAVEAILRPGHNSHVDILWRHSVSVAVAAGILAEATGESAPIAFTAGLLHEVGKVILVSVDATTYAQAVQDAANFKRSVLVTENQMFGFDHTEVGARLLQHWNLPSNIVTAVRHHHELAGAEPFERLAATIHLANAIAHGTGQKLAGKPKGLETAVDSLAILGFSPEQVTGLLPKMQVGLEKAKALTPA